MYLAVDSHHPEAWLDGLLQTMDSLPDAHWLALIDGVFDHGLKPFAAPVPTSPLYGPESTLHELASASPYLLPVGRRSGVDSRALIAALGIHCQGRPMLSFLASWQPADHLVRLWQPCLHPVAADEGSRYLLRFADTRVLPVLPGAMNPAAWAQLTAPLLRWSYVDRAGALETLWQAESHVEPATYPSHQLVLPQGDIDRMVDAAMPDAVLDLMDRLSPGSLPDTDRAKTYRLVAQACALAGAHGVDATADIVQLATVSLATNGSGLREQALLALLGDARRAPNALRDYLHAAMTVAEASPT
ncbi:hypothetical protein PI87_19280 [Ralstonia sp. A12]|uniref:DUF4123 domain-containing protein n=1 Tax=Ralstonia sp. A12 TaxID=1217052 RepID=UPI000574EF9F|nr:DUF4123 domain-containing protein [Ralstonia sp. A12]KHK52917.1 hypothetical protein PI87_19280 [Ralstonia sp. A12]